MSSKILILFIVCTLIAKSLETTSLLSFTRDFIQHNILGAPATHQNTVWDFDPEQGKARRVRFEALNGRLGEDLISRLGKGMDFDGPWGVKVVKPKPDIRYNLHS